MALFDIKTILVVALQSGQNFTNIISSKGNSICRDFTIAAMRFIRYPSLLPGLFVLPKRVIQLTKKKINAFLCTGNDDKAIGKKVSWDLGCVPKIKTSLGLRWKS